MSVLQGNYFIVNEIKEIYENSQQETLWSGQNGLLELIFFNSNIPNHRPLQLGY